MRVNMGSVQVYLLVHCKITVSKYLNISCKQTNTCKENLAVEQDSAPSVHIWSMMSWLEEPTRWKVAGLQPRRRYLQPGCSLLQAAVDDKVVVT